MAVQKNAFGLRKISIPLAAAGLAATVIAGYYAGAAMGKNETIFTWYTGFMNIIRDPCHLYYNGRYTWLGIGIAVLAYVLAVLYYMTTGKNYMAGKEYGNAKYADNAWVHKRLAEKLDKKDLKNTAVKTIQGSKKQIFYVNMKNRKLTQNIEMSLNTRYTDLNNNILVIGGSGAGKTFRFVGPNLMQMTSSFICTDPKGEIMRKYSGFLKAHGYEIKVVNLLNADGMRKSTRYNPFRYIRTDTDIVKLVTNFFENTKKKGASSGDQFWDDMAGLLLQAFFYYTREVGVEVEGIIRHDFKGVMKLVNMAKIEEDPMTGARTESELDRLFQKLEEEHPESLAVISYNKAMVGAADTVRSIISTLNSRTTSLQTDEILDLLSDDEVDIPTIGTRKTALFCIIPDNDKTYNFLVGMLYSQIFQELYYQADFVYGGAMPVHVAFMLDEFANVALPDGFTSLLSTMRSRNISSIIIIQNMAQIKELFEKSWETIPGNCDTLIFLGGNEVETHKYISELMGKQTIDKRTSSESKGKQGSFSRSYDVLGRELMLPDEVRKVDGRKCLVFIRGFDPVFDDKIHTNELPFWKEVCELEENFSFDARIERAAQNRNKHAMRMFTDDDLMGIAAEQRQEEEEYKTQCRLAEIEGTAMPEAPKRKIIEVSFEELVLAYKDAEQNGTEFDQKMAENWAITQTDKPEGKEEQHKQSDSKEKQEETAAFAEMLWENGFSEEQIEALRDLESCMSIEEVLELFHPDMILDVIYMLKEDVEHQ